jgi:hypothetical protein
MEGLTRLVSESLARHGFDRPLDYRRLRWSRWFRCESHHSLLVVPSQPGVFALAEEIMNLGTEVEERCSSDLGSEVEERRSSDLGSDVEERRFSDLGSKVEERRSSDLGSDVEERRFSAASGSHSIAALAAAGISAETTNRKPEAAAHRRMLAVTQFFEDDDMAFVLDRMLSRQNPMSARLSTGRYFVRFVVIEDPIQRRSICSALNQWMVSAAEKATGIGSHFATSLELTPATEYVPADDAQQSLFPNQKEEGNLERGPSSATARISDTHVAADAFVRPPARSAVEGAIPQSDASGSPVKPGFRASHSSATAPQLSSGAATNIHCPTPFPSGF